MNDQQIIILELDSKLQEIERRLTRSRRILQTAQLSRFESAEEVRNYNFLVSEQLRMENVIRLYRNLKFEHIGR
jgi:hypothetical protein